MTKNFDPKKLIELRREKFWTQEELATVSGVSARTIQRMETSKSVSVESWKAVAAAFDIDPKVLKQAHIETASLQSPPGLKKRQAFIGAFLCCLAGIIGCSFGWWLIFTGPTGFDEAVTEYFELTAFVTFATATCLMVPIMTWKRTLQ